MCETSRLCIFLSSLTKIQAISILVPLFQTSFSGLASADLCGPARVSEQPHMGPRRAPLVHEELGAIVMRWNRLATVGLVVLTWLVINPANAHAQSAIAGVAKD